MLPRSHNIAQQRLVDRDLRHTQTADLLVEVQTVLHFLKQRSPEQIVDNPVPRVRGRLLQVFHPEQNPITQTVVLNADIPVPGDSLQGLRPGLVLAARMRRFNGFFALFPDFKKSARVTRQVSARVVADTSSSSLGAHQMALSRVAAHSSPPGERTELVYDSGHVWVRLDAVYGSFWKNLDTQLSQWHPPWESWLWRCLRFSSSTMRWWKIGGLCIWFDSGYWSALAPGCFWTVSPHFLRDGILGS